MSEPTLHELDKRLFALEKIITEKCLLFDKTDETQWKEINFIAKNVSDKHQLVIDKIHKREEAIKAWVTKTIAGSMAGVGLVIAILEYLK